MSHKLQNVLNTARRLSQVHDTVAPPRGSTPISSSRRLQSATPSHRQEGWGLSAVSVRSELSSSFQSRAYRAPMGDGSFPCEGPSSPKLIGPRAAPKRRTRRAASASAGGDDSNNGPREDIPLIPLQSDDGEVAKTPLLGAAASSDDDSPPPEQDWRHTLSLISVLLAVFLNLMGFTVSGPILPALANHFELPASQIGYLSAAYPLGMFGGLFVWPKLSDSIGRRPIIVFSLFCSGVGFLLQAAVVSLGWSLWLFLALRVGSGALAGASPVIKACIADLAREDELPRFMGYREAAATLAFIVGPSIGGFMFSSWSLAAVISVSGWVSIVAALLVFACLEVPSSGSTSGQLANKAASVTAKGEEMPDACPVGVTIWSAISTICTVSFLYNFGQAAFDAFFPVMVSRKFELLPQDIGLVLTGLAVISFGMSAGGFNRIQRVFGLPATSTVGLLSVSTGLMFMGLSPNLVYTITACAVYVIGIPLFTPTVPIMLMQCIPPSMRGYVMGIDSAVNTVGRIISPIIFGAVYARFGEKYVFGGAAVVVFLAALITAFKSYRTQVEKDQQMGQGKDLQVS